MSLEEEIWTHRETPEMHVHNGKTMERHREKVATCKPRREVLEEIKPADAFILDLRDSRKIKIY